MKIKVIDAMCGKGKTSWSIQYMNEEFDKRFIYVTPYLSEIERVKKNTNNDLKEPNNKNDKGSKLESLRNLVSRGENIVCTHELFKLCDKELLELIKESEYTLILDEVLNVINQISITKSDLNILINQKIIEVDELTGYIKWMDNEYYGKFEELKELSKNDNLFLFNETFVFWTLHCKSFEVFEDVYILTYLFDGQIQRYYYDLHGFEYEKYSVINNDGYYELFEYDVMLDNREVIKDRLVIYEDKGKSKLNSNFCKKQTDNMFSSTWLKNCDKETIDRIKKNLDSYFKNTLKCKNKELFWTTIKTIAPKLKNSRNNYYLTDKKDNFVSVNIRATNGYKDCTGCAYVYNRYMNPIEKAFFQFHKVNVNEDVLALSDLIQFLFRGTIRNNDNSKLNVYIPSNRMRNLLYKYLEYEI